MVNKKKQKGSAWESMLVEELNKKVRNSEWKRIPASGSMGTTINEPMLMSDVKGEVSNFPMRLRGECKAGYNHSEGKETKQFTIKKEWLDKVAQEAKGSYSFPFLACKFDNARTGVKHFIVLDVDDFAYLINKITELSEEE
jgi:hypothetical protein